MSVSRGLAHLSRVIAGAVQKASALAIATSQRMLSPAGVKRSVTVALCACASATFRVNV